MTDNDEAQMKGRLRNPHRGVLHWRAAPLAVPGAFTVLSGDAVAPGTIQDQKCDSDDQ
jgi:hypothetical protein